MPIRLKKLIGTMLLVALVIVYALVATTVAAARLGEVQARSSHLAFFFFTGILWICAGDGHHQMADAAAETEEIRPRPGLQTVTSILPRLASGVVMPDSIVRMCATRW